MWNKLRLNAKNQWKTYNGAESKHKRGVDCWWVPMVGFLIFWWSDSKVKMPLFDCNRSSISKLSTLI